MIPGLALQKIIGICIGSAPVTGAAVLKLTSKEGFPTIVAVSPVVRQHSDSTEFGDSDSSPAADVRLCRQLQFLIEVKGLQREFEVKNSGVSCEAAEHCLRDIISDASWLEDSVLAWDAEGVLVYVAADRAFRVNRPVLLARSSGG